MAAAAMGRGLRGLWSSYQTRLEQQPVRTQVLSSGVLWAVGDALAQSVEGAIQRRRPALEPLESGSSSSQTFGDSRGENATAEHRRNLELSRVLKTSLFGFCFVGPVGHYWYEGLEHVVKNKLKFSPNSVRFIGAKVLSDTLIFGTVHLLTFFSYMGLASGKPWAQVRQDIARDFPPTFMTEGSMWLFVQMANFRWVPVRHQLLVVNFFCILDSAFLSWVKHQDDAPWKRYLTSLIVSPPKPKEK